MSKPEFIYVWEYIVRIEFLEEFKAAYGKEGEWVKFFESAPGYIGTELHQDINNSRRFITVDYWKSKQDRDEFKKANSGAFEAIDQRCEKFTESEKHLGDFNSTN